MTRQIGEADNAGLCERLWTEWSCMTAEKQFFLIEKDDGVRSSEAAAKADLVGDAATAIATLTRERDEAVRLLRDIKATPGSTMDIRLADRLDDILAASLPATQGEET